ncbi:MAG: SBBP repeat-containing protein, partial [Thermoplasmata archaeon]|nr:SBBP repeat-containing protein [Thermoplasmata archaeon]
PGADTSSIGFLVKGSAGLAIQEDGSLAMRTSSRDVVDGGLMAYYEGSPGTDVPVRFALHDHNTFGFELGRYDRSRTLVIDPIVYSTYLSGSEEDEINDMYVDRTGHVYVCGKTRSDDFPLTDGSFCMTKRERLEHAFVSKLSRDGTSLVYSTYIGGHMGGWANAIAVDEEGRAIVTGKSSIIDFPTTDGAFQSKSNDTGAAGDAFICMLSADGSSLVFSTFLGGEGYDNGRAITLGPDGNIYVTGSTESDDFPTTADAYQRTIEDPDDYDAFYAILNGNASRLLYSTLLGGDDRDFGNAIFVDEDGNAFIVGGAYSSDFPVTEGAYQTAFGGYRNDAFACKFGPDGDLTYSTLIGGSGSDWGYGLVVDRGGCAYIVGTTNSTEIPFTLGDPAPNWTGDPNSFLIKLEANGSAANFSKPLPDAYCFDIAFDPDGNLLLTGGTWAKDLPVTNGAIKRENDSYGDDGYVLKLSPDGKDILFLTYIGGTNDEDCWAVAEGLDGTIYVGGNTQSDDLPVTPGAVQTSFGDNIWSERAGFVTVFTPGLSSIVADAGDDLVVGQGEEVTIVGSGSKEGGGYLNFTWSFEHEGETATVQGQAFTTIFDVSGTYDLLLSVTDDIGNLSMDICRVTVTDTEQPVARLQSGGSIEVDIGTTYGVDGRHSTDNVGVARYEWVLEHGNVTFTHEGEWFNYTFDQPTVYNVTLTVWDAAGNSDTTAGTVTVRWDHEEPTILPPDDPEEEGLLGEDHMVSVRVSDNDEVSEVWLHVQYPSGWTINTSMSHVSDDLWTGSFLANQTGNITYTVCALDPSDNVVESTNYTVFVKEAMVSEDPSDPPYLIYTSVALVLVVLVLVIVLALRRRP